MTSKRKGFNRYHTEYIREKVEELKEIEWKCKGLLVPFLYEYILKFLDKKDYWLQMVNC